VTRILLDTHALLWALEGDARLSENARAIFLDSERRLYFSIASYWEICIKISLGRLRLAMDWSERLRQEMEINRVNWLAIEEEHCRQILELPFHHRDPFDRMLLAQAKVEKMAILSRDPRMSDYSVTVLW